LRRQWVLIFAAALALRVGFGVTRGDELSFYDSQAYDQIARHLAAGEGFHDDVGRQASRAPGYPLFLAACHAVGLNRPVHIYLAQGVIDALACVLLFALGRKMFGEMAGAIAGWVAALYPFFIYFCGILLAETLFTCGLVAYMLLLVRCREVLEATPELQGDSVRESLCSSAVPGGGNGTKKTASDGACPTSKSAAGCGCATSPSSVWALVAATGALAGALALVRSSFMLFPLFLLPFWAIRKTQRLRALATWGVMMAAMALVMTPWTVRNYGIFRHVIPTTLQVGESLYEANSPYAVERGGGPAIDLIDWVKDRGGVMMNEYQNNEFFKNAAKEWIRRHPGEFVALAFKKLGRFWNPVPNYGPYRSPAYVAVSLAAFIPIIALAVVGIAACRRRTGELLLLLSPVFYFTALHAVFVGSVRYRVPVMPFVILLAAVGASAWLAGRRPAAPAASGGEALRNG
jgi:hypothetical protein